MRHVFFPASHASPSWKWRPTSALAGNEPEDPRRQAALFRLLRRQVVRKLVADLPPVAEHGVDDEAGEARPLVQDGVELLERSPLVVLALPPVPPRWRVGCAPDLDHEGPDVRRPLERPGRP